MNMTRTAASASTIKEGFSEFSYDDTGDEKISVTSLMRRPSSSLPRIPRAYKNFGLMGTSGYCINILYFLLDITSDAFLLWSLHLEMQQSPDFHLQEQLKISFITTLVIACLPLILVNIISICLYHTMKSRSEEDVKKNILFNKGHAGKGLCVIMHVLLLGIFIRYYDMVHCGRNLLRGVGDRRRRMDGRTSVRSSLRSSLSRPDEVHEDVLEVKTFLKVLSMDTSTVDIIYTYTKICLQLFYQVFVVFVYSEGTILISIQAAKILLCYLWLCWYHLSYEEETRRMHCDARRLSLKAIAICFGWRAGTLMSRILAISSIIILKPNEDGGIVKVDSYQEMVEYISLFPLIALGILLCHWIVMIIWIHSRKPTILETSANVKKHPIRAFGYSVLLSLVHVFDYLNLGENFTGRRFAFYYTFIIAENIALITVWYLQLVTQYVWIKVAVLAATIFAFIIGLAFAIGYYAFVHPNYKSKDERHGSQACY